MLASMTTLILLGSAFGFYLSQRSLNIGLGIDTRRFAPSRNDIEGNLESLPSFNIRTQGSTHQFASIAPFLFS